MTKTPLKSVSNQVIQAAADRFRALGEVNRLRIIQQLQLGEKNVGELVKLTGLSQPNVSRHLTVLVNAKLAGRRKEGLNVLYRVIDDNLADLCHLVCQSVAKLSGLR